jgi:hypothetical protein
MLKASQSSFLHVNTFCLSSGASNPHRAPWPRDQATHNTVMLVIAVVGALFCALARPDREVSHHLRGELDANAAERES